jgi:hypothetical protein
MNHYEALDDSKVVPRRLQEEVYNLDLTFFYRGVSFDWSEEDLKAFDYLGEVWNWKPTGEPIRAIV